MICGCDVLLLGIVLVLFVTTLMYSIMVLHGASHTRCYDYDSCLFLPRCYLTRVLSDTSVLHDTHSTLQHCGDLSDARQCCFCAQPSCTCVLSERTHTRQTID